MYESNTDSQISLYSEDNIFLTPFINDWEFKYIAGKPHPSIAYFISDNSKIS